MCHMRRKGIAMKKNTLRRFSVLLALSLMFVMMLAGCGQSNRSENTNSPSSAPTVNSNTPSAPPDSNGGSEASPADSAAAATELYVQFGDDGVPYTMHLYDNDTAAAIARHVGTADWRLPIYNYDNYDNWEVMQYYDIPSRYDIPSNPESVTTEQAGAVYYSEPNRIVLFFGDAEVSG